MPSSPKQFPGPPRVRREPPTISEALFAAEGLSSDPVAQVEIASRWMGVPEEEVRPHMAAVKRSDGPRVLSGTRTVVVERRAARTLGRASMRA